MLLHSVTVTSPVFPFNNHGFDTEFARHATSHTFAIIANLVSMVSTGVVVRFPELKIGVTEAGISWMPFVCNRLDKEYLERRREVPFLTERPSHYLKRVYVATQPIEEPERLRDLVTLMELYDGEDTTIYASDWPHHDFDHPMKLNQVPFSEEQRRKVFGENALELFGIDRTGRRRDRGRRGPAGRLPGRDAQGRRGRRTPDRRVQHRGAPLRAAEPLPAPDRPAVRGPRRHRHAGGRSRAATGSRAGSWRTRSSPARGMASSTTCPPGAAWPIPEITLRRYPVDVRGDEVVVTVGGRRA